MAVERKLYTVEEFEQFLAQPENHDRLFELIDGEIVEKMPTQEHGAIALNIGSEFRIYLRTHPIGVASVETRHALPEDRYNDRIPDVAFNRRNEDPIVRQGAVPKMPDLAVEIKSPGDSYRQMQDTAAYYIAHGSQLVWLVYPEKRLVAIYRADGTDDILTENDTLSGEAVLPGFTLPIKTIFEF
ncbi:MAG: Uma2 family endonuclease [Anaerolineae bacterium]|nr:Uma2 family endonuclease [Anaerolineae bacterium]